MPTKPPFAPLSALLLTAAVVAGCSDREELSPAYQAACEGPPLRSVAEINKAMEEGYEVNRNFKCIDKASFMLAKQRQAEWEAARAPEAVARREAELAERRARSAEALSLQVAGAERAAMEPPPEVELRAVDVNRATEAEIAGVISVGPRVAAEIVAERARRPFSDWADLLNRVTGLSAALPAATASTCGLNVNGRSLDGAPPDARLAAAIAQRLRR